MRSATRMRARFALGCLLLATIAPACGSGKARLPAGEPLAVVLATPDVTMRAAAAARPPITIAVGEPTTTRTGAADLVPPLDPLETDALVALDLLRGAVVVDPYGGQGVRGVSTMRYDVSVDYARALAAAPAERRAALERLRPKSTGRLAEMAVWVDVAGRARRVQRSVELATSPPVTTADGYPAVVTTDYYGYAGERR